MSSEAAPLGTAQPDHRETEKASTTTITTLHAANVADSSNPLKADHKGVPSPQAPIDAKAKADANLSAPNALSYINSDATTQFRCSQ